MLHRNDIAHTGNPPGHPFIVCLKFSDADMAYLGGKYLKTIAFSYKVLIFHYYYRKNVFNSINIA